MTYGSQWWRPHRSPSAWWSAADPPPPARYTQTPRSQTLRYNDRHGLRLWKEESQVIRAEHKVWGGTSDRWRLVGVDVLQNGLQDLGGGGHLQRSAAGGLKRAEDIHMNTTVPTHSAATSLISSYLNPGAAQHTVEILCRNKRVKFKYDDLHFIDVKHTWSMSKLLQEGEQGLSSSKGSYN